jgi:hypothetical protein
VGTTHAVKAGWALGHQAFVQVVPAQCGAAVLADGDSLDRTVVCVTDVTVHDIS